MSYTSAGKVSSCARKRGCVVKREGALFTIFTVYYNINGNIGNEQNLVTRDQGLIVAAKGKPNCLNCKCRKNILITNSLSVCWGR